MSESAADLEAFRNGTRHWLEENCPTSMREPMSGDDDICWGGRKFVYKDEGQKLWLQRMAKKGWTVPTWPKKYGGAGLDHKLQQNS